jgi:hypothetical protein
MHQKQKTALYHASRNALPIGTSLIPMALNLLDGDIESLVEKYRPHRLLARNNAIYMTQDRTLLDILAPGHDNHYRVAPCGRIQIHDHAYINDIWRIFAASDNPERSPADRARLKDLARHYWSQKPKTNDQYSPSQIEHLAARAVVITSLN